MSCQLTLQLLMSHQLWSSVPTRRAGAAKIGADVTAKCYHVGAALFNEALPIFLPLDCSVGSLPMLMSNIEATTAWQGRDVE